METSKVVWIIAGVLVVAGLLDLKCKGAFYKMLPANVKGQVDRLMNNTSK